MSAPYLRTGLLPNKRAIIAKITGKTTPTEISPDCHFIVQKEKGWGGVNPSIKNISALSITVPLYLWAFVLFVSICLSSGRLTLVLAFLGLSSTAVCDKKWVWNDNRRSIDDDASSSNQQSSVSAVGQIKLKLDDQAGSSYNNKYSQRPQSDARYILFLILFNINYLRFYFWNFKRWTESKFSLKINLI